MKLMRVASMALAAYLVNSALRTSISISRSRLRMKGAYRVRIRSVARSLSLPTITRSGRMKSCTAEPSFRNSGFDTTAKSGGRPRAASNCATSFATASAVPTGTVLLLMISL